jgi:hypothetical protein
MKSNPASGTGAGESSTTAWFFAVGLGLAFLAFGSWWKLSSLQTVSAKAAARDVAAIAELRAENERLAGRPVAAPVTPPDPVLVAAAEPVVRGASRVEALDYLADLGRRGYFATPSPMTLLRQLNGPTGSSLRRVAQPAYMINATGDFGPGFAEFFGLAPAEAQALQAGIADWQEEMERALAAHTTVRREADGSVVLSVAAVPEAEALRGRFTSLLLEGLGPERYRAFLSLNAGQRPIEQGLLPASITGNVNFFGESAGTYTLRQTQGRLSVSYNLRSATGSSSGGGSSGGGTGDSPEAMRERLIKTHGPVMKLLPVDF